MIEVAVESELATQAYVLEPDGQRDGAGVIVGGGPINEPFLHRVKQDGRLFLYVHPPNDPRGTIALSAGPADYAGPTGQVIAVKFEEDFLVVGLFDGDADDEAARQRLADIEPIVREGIIERLSEVFSGTGVTIVAAGEGQRPADQSLLTYRGRREFVSDQGQDTISVIGCADSVIFGEVLSSGGQIDAGNRDPNDEAIVYVGSFRGTGACDPGLVLNSTNNIINALTITGTHETGHLLGLTHTALAGIMSPTPTVAFQRQLALQRSQIVWDPDADAQQLEVVTNVIQDPDVYFARLFSP